MKIFILEDNKDRIDFFKQKFIGHELTIFTDNASAEKFVSICPFTFDLVLLDHDLGIKSFVPSTDTDCGYHFVKHVVENDIKCIEDAKIIIHSQNTAGARNMSQLFLANGIVSYQVPFFYFQYPHIITVGQDDNIRIVLP